MAETGTISLRGSASGMLRYETNGGVTNAAVRLRGAERPAAVFFAERNGGVRFAKLDAEGNCSAPAADICGAAVFDGRGGLICYGALGSCGGMLRSRLSELRIRAAAELAKRDENAVPPESEPSSRVTGEILSAARRLFRGGSESAPADAAAEGEQGLSHEEYEAIPNPFPRAYPNSFWQRKRGEAILTGTAITPRGKLELIAEPAVRGRRPIGGRYLTDTGGRGYRVREKRI